MDTTTELTFKSEEERLGAIEALGDDPSKEGELDQIMNAKIVEGDSETPAETPTEPHDEPEAPAETPVEPGAETPPETTSETPELPEKFKSWGEFMKAYNESQQLIERQGRKIEELVSSTPEPRHPAEPRREPEMAPEKRTPQQPPQAQQSRINEIRTLRAELKEAAKDPEARFDEAFMEKREHLDDLLIEEMDYNRNLASTASDTARKANESYTQYMQRIEQEQRQKQHEQAWQNEVKQIDEFLRKPEIKTVYPISKSYAEVDRDYVDWSNRVASQYYGRPPRDNNEVAQAMAQLQAGSPTLIDKCRTANISVEPNQDIKNYLEICDLQDFQDGIRIDPTTGRRVQAMRYDPQLGREVPDRFPSIEAAYNHRLVSSGHFKKQVAEAKQRGGKEVLDALERRDGGVTEMGQEHQSSGLPEMSNAQAAQVLDQISPEEAMMAARQGDMTQLDKINNAMKALGVDPYKL